VPEPLAVFGSKSAFLKPIENRLRIGQGKVLVLPNSLWRKVIKKFNVLVSGFSSAAWFCLG